jgi:PAS domain S-box-containing protein
MQKLGTTPHAPLDFESELTNFYHKRLYLLFWVGFILFPLFLVLDYFVAQDYFEIFLVYRVLVSISLLILLYIHSKPGSKQYLFAISLIGMMSCGAAISLMVIHTGGYTSFYYVGMICVLVAFTAILPLNLCQSLVSGIIMYLIYLIPVLIFSQTDPAGRLVFFNNTFFFVFFLIVCVVKSNEDYKSRRLEFKLKKDLDYHAANLEQEVKHRIQKHEDSELRYKQLYENILDSLVVMDSKGNILIANPNFYKLIGCDNNDKGKHPSFLELVHPDDLGHVQDQMLEKLFSQTEIRDFQLRLLDNETQSHYMECSARGLQKAGETIGYQLVLRDISSRKELENSLVTSFAQLKNTRAATIMGLAKLTEYRDHDTGSHLERIQEYVKMLTEELASFPDFRDYLTPEYVEDIHLSCILHDIGKVGIPDAVLLKPGRLDTIEFDIIKRHSQYGGDALKAVESKIKGDSFLTLGREIAYFHHEKWDGTGYPNALKKNTIPLSARIVSVADVYDALTSKRIYKEAYSHETAVKIMVSERNKHFDPQVIDAFLATADQFDLTRKQR